jgi:hypothetical protein
MILLPRQTGHSIQIFPSSDIRIRINWTRIFYSFIFLLIFLFQDVHAKDIDIGMSAAFKGPTGGLGIELYRLTTGADGANDNVTAF